MLALWVNNSELFSAPEIVNYFVYSFIFRMRIIMELPFIKTPNASD